MSGKEFERKKLKFLSKEHSSYSKFLQWIPFSAKIVSDVTGNPRCISLLYNVPVEDFQFTKSHMNLSDMYWTMLPLTCMAYKNSEIDDFGILTCVDMRKFLTSKKVNRPVGQTFTELFLTIGRVNPKMTVRQVGGMFREKFNQMKNDGILYGALYNMNFDFPSLKNRFLVEISKIGGFEVKRPIVDVFIPQSMISIQSEWYIGFTSFSRNVHGKNIIIL